MTEAFLLEGFAKTPVSRGDLVSSAGHRHVGSREPRRQGIRRPCASGTPDLRKK